MKRKEVGSHGGLKRENELTVASHLCMHGMEGKWRERERGVGGRSLTMLITGDRRG